jgi:O-6-methylguanine DNA methyltransferase
LGSERVVIGTIATPIGTYGAVLSARGLCRLTSPTEVLALCHAWVDRWEPTAIRLPDGGELSSVTAELLDYLAGRRRAFTLPLDLRGTPFQLAVWAALRSIPFGEVRTYAQIAAMIGRPRAVRAVGAANGANPVAVIVPCHRVIGSNGELVGYAGGIEMKRMLLEHEQGPCGALS